MRIEELGIDPKTRRHNAVMTHTENAFLACLWPDHTGRANLISARDLAIAFAEKLDGQDITENGDAIEEYKRSCRHLVNHFLRDHEKVPIFSAAGVGGGYWIAESEEEAAAFYDTFRKRGLTGLVKASRGKQAAIVEMMQQVSFEFEDLLDESGIAPPAAPKKPSGGVPLQVIDRFLEKMLSDPERYTEDLRKISEKFGSVLFSKVQARAIKEKVRELNEVLGELEV